ncbi:hypothetical protein I6M44_15680 [Shewanella algae]|uniref:hypothetical protein n=1 Tax=Shewanella algae TaxID=38313 RepID=UPI001AAC5D86|nr:hypothetical protein [Shewanella algae]MBO2625490.1 hypothetical protein [Shewanella algae]BCV37546.1 hypothetical protein TUM17377_28740 [Shewanella chilikensis]
MDILDYYDLKEWWNTALTPAQRDQISRDYQPMGYPSGERYLYAKLVGKSYGDTGKCCLLDVLACVAKDDAKDIIWNKTEQAVKEALSKPKRNYIDIHLALAGLIKYHYRLRNDQAHYEKAKEFCLLQISISSKLVKKFRHPEKPKELKRLHKLTGMTHPYYDEPQILPSHTGYKQLAIILEKEGDLDGALELSQKALEQGWSDDYEKRIAKLVTKIAKRK